MHRIKFLYAFTRLIYNQKNKAFVLKYGQDFIGVFLLVFPDKTMGDDNYEGTGMGQMKKIPSFLRLLGRIRQNSII